MIGFVNEYIFSYLKLKKNTHTLYQKGHLLVGGIF